MYIVFYLSCSRVEQEAVADLDITVHEIHSYLSASPTRIEQIRETTSKDYELCALKDIISSGWPQNRHECPKALQQYWNYRDELAVEDGILMKGVRLIIPKQLQQEVLNQIHYAHLGIEKCKLKARNSVFWRGINSDIEEMVRKCSTCQAHQLSQTREPMQPHPVPPRPWHTLSTDLFHWEQNTYLLVVDMYSKFPLVRKLNSLSSKSVIAHLKGIMEEHGIPELLISDNGPQYASEDFQKFAACYGFTHNTTSPHYAQANGFVERQVQTIKKLFTKSRETGTDPHLAMLNLRTTPLDHNIASPSELLNSRLYKSLVPSKQQHHLKSYNEQLQQRQDMTKIAYDKKSRCLAPLQPSETVRVQDPITKVWTPGQVINQCSQPRSYNVQTKNSTVRRNRCHIRKTVESFQPRSANRDNSPLTNQRRSQRTVRAPNRLDL